MRSLLELTSAPASEPVSLSDIKKHLRGVNSSADDDTLTTKIKAAREWVENHTSRALINQTWRMSIERFPNLYWDDHLYIKIPRSPVIAISSIEYVATDGTTTTLSSSSYLLRKDSNRAFVSLAYGQSWPVTRYQDFPIQINFTAGYGLMGSSVPAMFIEAIMFRVQAAFDNNTLDDMHAIDEHTASLLYSVGGASL
jgi:uncharacterized phiE125 gp8 family phage protein